MPNQIVISNHSIPLDHEKRVNLNALHHLSAANENKRPSQWLRLKSTQELIDTLDNSQSAYLHSALKVINGGDNQGSYAHELLAISYAGWISPKFQLQVNQAFIDSHQQPLVPDVPLDQMLIEKDKYIELLEVRIAYHEMLARGRRVNLEEEQRIVYLRDKGYAIADIARLTGRSDSKVRDVLKGGASC
ncbi:KilA-N domain-containing protein [Vibrio parahaemolyticus]|uniref:KilA-N domain-containing protein n=1 Tax=Vibrio parahaemolyticus TaxID=670 RepID=UPI00177D88D5|nr:KilA-N domain-containing protein [Vibrio parahaemolyticus]MBD6983494.1 hypothetical protein [Vibrio parahaemolyticus]MBD6986753.1 hypothetical protein [Vibrio parahaemolyticus]